MELTKEEFNAAISEQVTLAMKDVTVELRDAVIEAVAPPPATEDESPSGLELAFGKHSSHFQDDTRARGIVVGPIIDVAVADSDVVEVSDALLDLAYTSDDVRPGFHLLLEVADSGHGMDEADIAKAFDPSYTTKETNGGLGLATVLNAVRNHGGAILVDSKPGTGTRFCVLIPKRESQSKKAGT